MSWVILALTVLPLLQGTLAEQCGSQAGGALCPGGLCCSQFGWCDDTSEHCNEGCQSQCTPSEVGDISTLIPQSTFNEMLKHRNDAACPASGFYTYDAFINAANSFPAFATSGDDATRKREIAAFLAQTSHETTGGWSTAPDGPYAWGYCHKKELDPQSDYCQSNPTYPCAPGQKYYGRGPIQLSWNYNYGPCGQALGVNLLSNPDLLENDSLLSFKSALWFWMTPQPPKPSPHDVITGQWTPTPSDQAAGRVPGYGLTTNIINGGLECGQGPNEKVKDRIGFYKRYCDILGVGYGSNLDCYNQQPYPPGLLVNAM